MKIVHCAIIHYGVEYLRESIAAAAPFVDQFIALYSPLGSQGHRPGIRCPESEEELRSCYDQVANRTIWHNEQFGEEGSHRRRGYEMAGDALILQHDADEIWKSEDLESAIKFAIDTNSKEVCIDGFINFWRSFGYACVDVWQPIRILNFNGNGKRSFPATIYHMSYAQRVEIVRYKIMVSGHKNEFRPEWFNDIFLANRKEDCHPTVKHGWWNAMPFDKLTLPKILKTHPNYEKEIIQ